MRITAGRVIAIAPHANRKIANGVAIGLIEHGMSFGLDKPHILAHFIAQIAHESAGFKTTVEYASGRAYEGRRDLGNIHPGDGRKFRGHGLIQVTGRANHRAYTEWCQRNDIEHQDFEEHPQQVATFPHAFLAAVWYWSSRNLNYYAGINDLRTITRKINGGYNGLADRERYYVRAALVLLGYGNLVPLKSAVASFQRSVKIRADGVAGPVTQRALHDALRRKSATERPAKRPAPEKRSGKTKNDPGLLFWKRLAKLVIEFFARILRRR